MITESSEFVDTALGRLYVRRAGSGPPVVLWHSLFVDSASWGQLFDRLAERHSVTAVDGPCHGSSDGLTRDFTFAEVADAAVAVIDRLDLTAPVDWVGNAWGGHIGVQVAIRHPNRLHTLTTIGTPARALTARERWTMCWPLVQIYRVLGPRPWLVNILSDVLIGPEAIATEPDQAAAVMAAFTAAPRAPMAAAMRSMMLHRPGMATEMTRLRLPVLMLAARGDGMGAGPADARAVAATITDARVATVAGAGHVTPLLIDVDGVHRRLVEFWSNHPR